MRLSRYYYYDDDDVATQLRSSQVWTCRWQYHISVSKTELACRRTWPQTRLLTSICSGGRVAHTVHPAPPRQMLQCSCQPSSRPWNVLTFLPWEDGAWAMLLLAGQHLRWSVNTPSFRQDWAHSGQHGHRQYSVFQGLYGTMTNRQCHTADPFWKSLLATVTPYLPNLLLLIPLLVLFAINV